MFMHNIFKHDLVFLTNTGVCSPTILGLIRKDETAAIIAAEYENELQDACMLRYYRSDLDVRDYYVRRYYRDTQRALGNSLVKPMVIELWRSSE